MEQSKTPRPVPGEFTTSAFTNLNVKPGESGGCTPEAEAALKEFASTTYKASSSIKESGPVTIPSEGGPDARRK